MKTRVISGVILFLITFASIFFGSAFLAGILLAISFIAYYELSKAIGLHGNGIRPGILELIGYISIAVYYVLVYMQISERFFTVWIILSLLLMAAAYVFTFPRYKAGLFMGAFFSVIYAPVMFSYIYLTRCRENGFWLVWFVFICAWISDTCAYFVGVKFGKHKLAPILSPKKSIEGSIGGIVGTALCGVIYGLVLMKVIDLDASLLLNCAVIGALGSIFSQIGDLVASGIKRNYDIKDYGKLIPGHGGIMDRFDSVIVTAPLIYFLVTLFM